MASAAETLKAYLHCARTPSEETLQRIRRDFNHISGVFSINCVFRYLLFSQEHHMEDYLKTMSTLGDHAGLIGFGEHYNQQFVNQTMTCVVFE